MATNRSTGDFPGGTADLDYRFTMEDDRIAEPVFAPRSTDPMKPTVVLVHGAFADSSSWNGVIARLREEGYPVIAVANPLRDLHRDAEFLRTVRAALDQATFTAGDGATATDLYNQQDRFRQVFAADVDPRVASLMAVTQRPILAEALDGKATRCAWRSVPSWTMVTLQDLAIPADSMRFMAERANSRTIEIDASHAVTVSQPRAVAELIGAAARTTTGGPPDRHCRARVHLGTSALRGRRRRDAAPPRQSSDRCWTSSIPEKLRVEGVRARASNLTNGRRHERAVRPDRFHRPGERCAGALRQQAVLCQAPGPYPQHGRSRPDDARRRRFPGRA